MCNGICEHEASTGTCRRSLGQPYPCALERQAAFDDRSWLLSLPSTNYLCPHCEEAGGKAGRLKALNNGKFLCPHCRHEYAAADLAAYYDACASDMRSDLEWYEQAFAKLQTGSNWLS